MTKIREIRNPKLGLVAELHSHRLNDPPKGTPQGRFYCTVNGERPPASEMRETEDEAARDARIAIGLPADGEPVAVAPPAEVAPPAGAPATPA